MPQSYANPGGTGDRRALIEMTTNTQWTGGATNVYTMIDGNTGNQGFVVGTGGDEFRFDFFEPRCIDEAKWYQNTSASHGTWKWQGSSDGSSWTDVGSTFNLGNGTSPTTHTTLNGNTTAYRYWRLFKTAGNMSTTPFINEVEFQIDDNSANAFNFTTDALSYGDRDATISVTFSPAVGAGTASNLVDGLAPGATGCAFQNGQTSQTVTFDLGSGNAKCVQKIVWMQLANTSHGNVKWQGSNDNSSYTDVSSTFSLGGVLRQLQDLSGNNTAYRYYRLTFAGGTTSNTPTLAEVNFGIGTAADPPDGAGDMEFPLFEIDATGSVTPPDQLGTGAMEFPLFEMAGAGVNLSANRVRQFWTFGI